MSGRAHARGEEPIDPLSALQAGDPGPFEAFVEREATAFVAFFVRLGAGRTEAEDLAQDLFVKLFRHAAHYRPQGRFDSYAFRVARNAWADRQRRRAVRRPASAGFESEALLLESVPGDGPGPEESAARVEDEGRLRAAVAELPEAQRLVLELALVRGLPYADVAERLEIPVGTVKSRMFHAVRRLREALGEEPS